MKLNKTIQKSLMPDERPDQEIKQKRKSFRSNRSLAISYLKKEGCYNYCKMVEAIKQQPDGDFVRLYGKTKAEVIGMHNEIFGTATNCSLSIEEFLSNVKNISDYRAPQWIHDLIKDMR